MKLSEKRKQELRKEIYVTTLNIPNGERLKIDNNVLDELIFFKGKMIDGTLFKIPIWTGDFLSKIDLSKLSFDGVRFDIPYCKKNFYNQLDDDTKKYFTEAFVTAGWGVIPFEIYYPPYLDSEGNIYDFKSSDNFECKITMKYKKDYLVNFANTNINLTSLPERLMSCNFANVDLSNLHPFFIEIAKCNFKNTKLNIGSVYDITCSKYSDFSDNDYSSLTVNRYAFVDLFNLDNRDSVDSLPNLSNTGINFDFLTTKIAAKAMRKYNLSQINIIYIHEDKKYGRIENCKALEKLKNILESGIIEGCYINGKLIESNTTLSDIPLTDREIEEYNSGKVIEKVLKKNNKKY